VTRRRNRQPQNRLCRAFAFFYWFLDRLWGPARGLQTAVGHLIAVLKLFCQRLWNEERVEDEGTKVAEGDIRSVGSESDGDASSEV